MDAHGPALIATIAIALSAAFVGGLIARHLRLPAIVGYLLAGVAIGPPPRDWSRTRGSPSSSPRSA